MIHGACRGQAWRQECDLALKCQGYEWREEWGLNNQSSYRQGVKLSVVLFGREERGEEGVKTKLFVIRRKRVWACQSVEVIADDRQLQNVQRDS